MATGGSDDLCREGVGHGFSYGGCLESPGFLPLDLENLLLRMRLGLARDSVSPGGSEMDCNEQLLLDSPLELTKRFNIDPLLLGNLLTILNKKNSERGRWLVTHP